MSPPIREPRDEMVEILEINLIQMDQRESVNQGKDMSSTTHLSVNELQSLCYLITLH